MRIGIDLGGTKIEGTRARCRRRENARLRVATPAARYEDGVQAIVDVVGELERRVGARCTVGIGHPGAISPATGLIKNANSTRLNGRPLADDLERCSAPGAAGQRRQLPGRLRGDRRRGGRLRHRVRRDPRHRRRRRRGDRRQAAHRRAGDRRRMGPQSPAPSARRRAARAALLLRPHRLHRDLAERPRLQHEFQRRTGRDLRATDIAEAALAGDAEAAAQMELYCDRLARALSVVINIIDPHAIVLGGGLSRMSLLYTACPNSGRTATSSPSRNTSSPSCLGAFPLRSA